MLISQKCCNLSCVVSYNNALHKKPSTNQVWFWAGVSSSHTLHYTRRNPGSVGRQQAAQQRFLSLGMPKPTFLPQDSNLHNRERCMRKYKHCTQITAKIRTRDNTSCFSVLSKITALPQSISRPAAWSWCMSPAWRRWPRHCWSNTCAMLVAQLCSCVMAACVPLSDYCNDAEIITNTPSCLPPNVWNWLQWQSAQLQERGQDIRNPGLPGNEQHRCWRVR